MKALCFILFWGLLLTSCKEVTFREPQPAGVTALREIPSPLLGRYRGTDDEGKDTDTLFIETWGYHFKDGKGNDWLGRGQLSDTLVVKFYENYYFVNFRSGNQWVLRVVKQKTYGDLEFMSINIGDDNKRKIILDKLSKRFTVKEIKGKDETFYEINPTKSQLMDLIKDGFFSSNVLEKINK